MPMAIVAWRCFVCLVLAWGIAGTRSARAFDWSPDNRRLLGDPAYLPLAGQVAGSFTYARAAGGYDFSTGSFAGTVSPSHWTSTGNQYLPALSYGITDDVTVSADFGWGDLRSQDSFTYTFPVPAGRLPVPAGRASASRRAAPALPVSALPVTALPQLTAVVVPLLDPGPAFTEVQSAVHGTYLSSGPEDPEIRATWRAIDQRAAPANLDLTLGYAPDIFPARDPGPQNSGTMAFGGQRATLRAAVSRETRFLTGLAYAALGYNGRRDIGQPGGAGVLRYAPHPDYAFGVQGEARPLPVLAVNFGLGAERTAPFHVQTIAPGVSVPDATYRPGFTVSPYLGVVVPFLRDHAAVELLYQHDFVADETLDGPNGSSGRRYSQGSDLLAARLLFAFGLI